MPLAVQDKPTAPPDRSSSSRSAALWATAVAVPVALLCAYLLIDRGTPDPAGPPAPAASQPALTAPVTMTAPALDERAAGVCRALVAELPDRVRDRLRRPVTGAEQNAAYGEPPLTVACGGSPATVSPTDTLYRTDGLCWHGIGSSGRGAVFTTVDREVPVRITFPTGYEQPAQWANEFTAAIVKTVPAVAQRPTGCT